MIDNIDNKIIMKLQEDGRVGNKDLAKFLGINPSTVSKRLKRLLNSEIIKIRALPNLNKLGYVAQALLVIDADFSKIGEVTGALYKNFYVNMIVTVFGRYNILITIHYVNWNDLLQFVSTELSGMDGVNRVETYLIKEVKLRYFGVFNDGTDVVKIDNIDQKIIELLAENGRYTAQYLANQVGVSLPTCLRRIRYLLNNNLITIRALPNPTKFGYVADIFSLLEVKWEHLESVCSILSSLSNIHSLYVLFSGNYNILFGIHDKTPEELFSSMKMAIEKVSTISTITDMKTYIRGDVIKRYYGGFFISK